MFSNHHIFNALVQPPMYLLTSPQGESSQNRPRLCTERFLPVCVLIFSREFHSIRFASNLPFSMARRKETKITWKI